MINKAETYVSSVTGHEITVSRNACVRMVDRGNGIEHLGRHEVGTETVCKGNMIELPLECLPEDDSEMEFTDKIKAAGDVLKGYVLAGDLSDTEVEAILSLYPAWEADRTYKPADGLLRHSGKLYQINQEHTSQAHFPPDSEGVTALYSEAVPEGVIAAWEQPEGSHDAYMTGDKVTFNGHIWESTIDNNVWSPADYPQGWTDLGVV